MDVPTAQIWGPGEGRSLAPAAGAEISLKSVAKDTDGGWTIFEYTAPPNFTGPPPHFHKQTDEAFFVLDGTVRFQLDGETRDLAVGGYVRVPPGVVHAFSTPADAPARFLGLAVPGGLERYFEQLREMMAAESAWPAADMAPLMALMARHDTFPPPAK